MPLRPIISTCGTATYKLSKFVANLLSTSMADRTGYNVKDTFDFVSKIKSIKIPNNYVIISLDVINLFTNIPLDMVVMIVENNWNLLAAHCKFDVRAFVSMLKFIFENTCFSFQDVVYSQLFGAPMGSPLSPILATIIMDHVLDSVIPKLSFELPFVYKFVDDIVTVVPSDMIAHTLSVFNSFNEHIQFTVEEERDNFVPFLDCKVIRDGTSLVTDWYTKPTFSGRFINYYSNHSFKHKMNTLIGMKDRISKICDVRFVQRAYEKLRFIFVNNGYPSGLVNRVLFSQSAYKPSIFDITPHTQKSTTIYKKICHVPTLTARLISIFRPGLNETFKIVPHYDNKLDKLFSRIKDRNPRDFESNVIYSIQCNDCEGKYVGVTSQWLKNRVSKHRSECNLGRTACALACHATDNNHSFDFQNVTILDRERNYFGRLFLEMYHINIQENTVNFRTDVEGLSDNYAYVIEIDKNRGNDHTRRDTSSFLTF